MLDRVLLQAFELLITLLNFHLSIFVIIESLLQLHEEAELLELGGAVSAG